MPMHPPRGAEPSRRASFNEDGTTGVLVATGGGARPIAPRPNAVYPVSMTAERTPTTKRSLVKALTYRVFIVCLDFIVIYIMTRKVEVALGFMIVSNVYTTVGYFLHERLWARIRWGTATTTG